MAKHTFFCVDGHTCGNPVRLVTGGGPVLDGGNMIEKRAHFLAEFDWMRKSLMFEPRGHDMMSGAFLYPSTRDDCDIAILFIETSGCLPMCGHGTIGAVTLAIEEGFVTPQTPGVLYLDAPAGRIKADYEMKEGLVSQVRLTNIASYLHSKNLTAQCPGLGDITVDVAYGGNFYAIVERQENFQDIDDCTSLDLIGWSLSLRKALNEKYQFVHPEHPEIKGLSHILWTGKPRHKQASARNAVFYGNKAIDRSPCGTGTSARMAQWAARGDLNIGDSFIHESIIGSLFNGRVEAAATVGNRQAIIPSVAGWARKTGYNTIFVDSNDPFAAGFQLP